MGDDGLGPKGRLALAAALGTGVVIGAAGLVVYQVCTVISAIMPPPPFFRPVFSKFFGRRCLVEGLVSVPAHPLPPPKKLSTPTKEF